MASDERGYTDEQIAAAVLAVALRKVDARMVKNLYAIAAEEIDDDDESEETLNAYAAAALRRWISRLLGLVLEVEEPDEPSLIVAGMVVLSRLAVNVANHDRRRFVELADVAVDAALTERRQDEEEMKALQEARKAEQATEAERIRMARNPHHN